MDWEQVDVWWGDERWVPAASDERNEKRPARRCWPGRRPRAPDPRDAAVGRGVRRARGRAAWYADQCARRPPTGSFPRLDLLLLGMGPEGHVASIFPDSPAGPTSAPVVPSATARSRRRPASASASRRSTPRRRCGCWSPATRRRRPSPARSPGPTPSDLPAAGVHGSRATRWLLDRAAAAELPG